MKIKILALILIIIFGISFNYCAEIDTKALDALSERLKNSKDREMTLDLLEEERQDKTDRENIPENIKKLSTKELIERLGKVDSIDWNTKRFIITELGNRKVKEAVPHIIPFLKDKNLSVQNCVCRALGKIKDKESVSVLIERLNDKNKNWSVQKRAAKALVKIGAPEIFRALLDHLLYETEIERESLIPISRYSNPTPDEYIERLYAKLLRKFIMDSSQRDLYISILKRKINDRNFPEEFRYRLATVLGKLKEKDAVPILIEALDKSKKGDLRTFIAILLGNLGDRKAIPALKRALHDNYLLKYEGDIHYRISQKMVENRKKHQEEMERQGRLICSAGELEKQGEYYLVHSYTVRNAAAGALTKLGVKLKRKGNEYIVIDEKGGQK
jgi:HEAT repeat protein